MSEEEFIGWVSKPQEIFDVEAELIKMLNEEIWKATEAELLGGYTYNKSRFP